MTIFWADAETRGSGARGTAGGASVAPWARVRPPRRRGSPCGRANTWPLPSPGPSWGVGGRGQWGMSALSYSIGCVPPAPSALRLLTALCAVQGAIKAEGVCRLVLPGSPPPPALGGGLLWGGGGGEVGRENFGGAGISPPLQTRSPQVPHAHPTVQAYASLRVHLSKPP